jgi:hypothetical protein
MFDTYLVADKTAINAKGDGPVVDLGVLENRVVLLQLRVTGMVEQESLDVSIFGGPDEKGIIASPLASYPQLFYRGDYPLLLDLTGQPQVNVLRAHWEVNRWGRGPETPWFEFSLQATEVPPELLRERGAQQSRREQS